MADRTPEKVIPRSSRATTPHSRRRSKTPVRTPRRRRATIVSANLLTPRRHRRPSSTPQNTLRILSRALAKQVPVAESPTTNVPAHIASRGQEEIERELRFDRNAGRYQERNRAFQVASLGEEQNHEPQNFDQEFDFQEDLDRAYAEGPPPEGDFDEQPYVSDVAVYHHDELESQDALEFRRRLSFRQSGGFTQYGLSDIALPAGIMPDHDLDATPLSDPFGPASDPEDADAGLVSSFIEPSKISKIRRDSHSDLSKSNELEKQPVKKSKRSLSSSSRKYSSSTESANGRKIQKFAQTFARKKLSKEAILTLGQTSDQFFNQVTDDISAYTKHSRSKELMSIKTMYLLLKRQRQIKSVDSLIELVDEYLPLEKALEIQRHVHKLRK